MAVSASAFVANDTNAAPRGCPVTLSFNTMQSRTCKVGRASTDENWAPRAGQSSDALQI
jgi:hypothetical protein